MWNENRCNEEDTKFLLDVLDSVQCFATEKEKSNPDCKFSNTFRQKANQLLHSTKTQKPKSEYEKQSIIGSGGFGHVYQVQRPNGDKLALKRCVNLTHVDLIFNERNVMIKLGRYGGVVGLIESFFDGAANFVMPLMRCNLMQITPRLTEKVVKIYTLQLLTALAHIHDQHILHMDLKPRNVMVDFSYNLRIGDFGASTVLETGDSYDCPYSLGTPFYFAPELCRATIYTAKSDIWALGVTIYEVLCEGRLMFSVEGHSNKEHHIFRRIRSKEFRGKKLGELKQKQFVNFLATIFQDNPISRPSCKDAITLCHFLQDLGIAPADINNQLVESLLLKVPELQDYIKPLVQDTNNFTSEDNLLRKIRFAGFGFLLNDAEVRQSAPQVGSSKQTEISTEVKLAEVQNRSPHEKRRNSLRCKQCSCTFASVYNLNRHITTVHQKNARRIRCPRKSCKETFAHKIYLKSHLKSIHEKLDTHLCTVCQVEFGTRQKFSYHKRKCKLAT